MKIIEVCPRYYPFIGGIETHVREISDRIKNRGHEIEIFTTDPTGKLKKEEIINGIRVRRFKSIAPNESYFFTHELYNALKKESYDVLHAHSFQAFPSFIAFMARKSDKKFIFTPHYQLDFVNPLKVFLHGLYDQIQKKMFFKSNKVICVSNHEMKTLQKKFNIPFEKTVVIFNGLNIEEIQKIKKPEKKYDFEIIYTGRLERRKNIHLVLPALKKLIEENPKIDIHYTVIGKGFYKKKLLEFIKKLGLSEHVSFHQDLSKNELMEKYKRADVFVCLSNYEAFGISVFEALACKTPVIVSDTGGFLSFVKNNYNGFILNSPSELIEKLRFLLKNKLHFKQDFTPYSWDSITEETLRVFTDS